MVSSINLQKQESTVQTLLAISTILSQFDLFDLFSYQSSFYVELKNILLFYNTAQAKLKAEHMLYL